MFRSIKINSNVEKTVYIYNLLLYLQMFDLYSYLIMSLNIPVRQVFTYTTVLNHVKLY